MFCFTFTHSQRPWSELESNYAIMFKVGMGEVPPTPTSLSEEGQAFLSDLLQHDPKQRETAANLLEHNFLKVLVTSLIIVNQLILTF